MIKFPCAATPAICDGRTAYRDRIERAVEKVIQGAENQKDHSRPGSVKRMTRFVVDFIFDARVSKVLHEHHAMVGLPNRQDGLMWVLAPTLAHLLRLDNPYMTSPAIEKAVAFLVERMLHPVVVHEMVHICQGCLRLIATPTIPAPTSTLQE